MALIPEFEAFARGYDAGREPDGLYAPGGRSRHAGLADAQADRRAERRLHARIGHRRRGARALFDHRHEARPDLALSGHDLGAEPLGPLRSRGLRAAGREAPSTPCAR